SRDGGGALAARQLDKPHLGQRRQDVEADRAATGIEHPERPLSAQQQPCSPLRRGWKLAAVRLAGPLGGGGPPPPPFPRPLPPRPWGQTARAPGRRPESPRDAAGRRARLPRRSRRPPRRVPVGSRGEDRGPPGGDRRPPQRARRRPSRPRIRSNRARSCVRTVPPPRSVR